MNRRSTRILAIAGTLAVAGASLTACSASGSASGGDTIVYWNQTADPATVKAEDAIIADFEKAHPTIHVKQTRYESESKLTPLTKNAWRTQATPDVVYAEVPTARELYGAGLAEGLTKWEKQYGWDDAVTESGRSWTTADDGTLFGLGVESELDGLMWNTTALQKLGLSVPTTMDQLVNVCQVARKHDLVPISSGDNGAGWIWYFYLGLPIVNQLGPKAEIAFASHESGKWTDPDIKAAVETALKTAKDADCFIPQMSSLDNNTALSLLESGKALGYSPAATGNIAPVEAASPKDSFAFTPWPAVPGGKGQYFMQGMGSAWVMNAKSTHKDDVAQFINYMIQKKTATQYIEKAGFLPPVAGVDVDDLDVSPLFKKTAHSLIDPGAQLGETIDLKSSDAFDDLIGREGQEAFSGQITVDQYLQDLQAAWVKDKP